MADDQNGCMSTRKQDQPFHVRRVAGRLTPWKLVYCAIAYTSVFKLIPCSSNDANLSSWGHSLWDFTFRHATLLQPKAIQASRGLSSQSWLRPSFQQKRTISHLLPVCGMISSKPCYAQASVTSDMSLFNQNYHLTQEQVRSMKSDRVCSTSSGVLFQMLISSLYTSLAASWLTCSLFPS